MDTKEKARSYEWKIWLKRPFGAFIMSVFEKACTPEYCKRAYMEGCTMDSWLFQYGDFYESDKVWNSAVERAEKFMKNRKMKENSINLLKFRKESIKEIKKLIKKKEDPREKLRKLRDIYWTASTYVWSAHILERVYRKQIDKLASEHKVEGDIVKFIGDHGHPKRKNTHALMEDALRKGVTISDIHKKYSWLKVRNCFDDPFTLEDIEDIAKHLKEKENHERLKIPKEMKGVFSDIQEVVWYRTARTDILYELLFLSRPIIKEIGDYYKIPFDSLRDYTINGLIDGKLERYDYEKFTCFGEFGVNYYFNEKIIDEEGHNDIDHVKGNIAFKGNVKGKVKIVLELKDLIKIEKGDILVTQMTVPSFISAMVKASAFVTDEGGITCHAAIIAREMKKPCVIGTRIATKVFKDGDIVEVDADNGVVRKVKNVRQKGRLN